MLDEDEETCIKRNRYIRTGETDFSMAFTYAWLASGDPSGMRWWMAYIRKGGSPWIA